VKNSMEVRDEEGWIALRHASYGAGTADVQGVG
jgi:hypothetical protein